MNGLALAFALVLAQGSATRAAPAPAPEPAAAPATTPAPEPRSMERDTAPASRRRLEAPAEPFAPAGVTTTARRRRSTPSPTSTESPTSPPPRSSSGRDEAGQTARQFLEALVRGDPSALAAIASDRFSFDGDVQSGRETIRRTWRDLLLARPAGPTPSLGALELLEAEDAAIRFGKPPARLASLIRRGVTVAIADVGGRTVVLFLAREGSRMAVLGMHD